MGLHVRLASSKAMGEAHHGLLRGDEVAECIRLQIEDEWELIRANVNIGSHAIHQKPIRMGLARDEAPHWAVPIELVERLVHHHHCPRREERAPCVAQRICQPDNVGTQMPIQRKEATPGWVPFRPILLR